MGALFVLYFVLFLPLALLTHKIEVLVKKRHWIEQNEKELSQKYPRIKKMMDKMALFDHKAYLKTMAMEFVFMFLAIMYILAMGPGRTHVWATIYLWMMLHMLIHIYMSIATKRYVPGLITSVCILALSFEGLAIMYNKLGLLEFSACMVASMFLTIIGTKCTEKMLE